MMYPAICDAVHAELEKLEDKYSGGAQMTEKDLIDFDRMVHALKSIATYEAMKETDTGRSRNRYYEREYRRY